MTSSKHSKLRSFLPIPADSPFPIQNLPYGVFRTESEDAPRIGVAIGEWILDLSVLEQQGLLNVPGAEEGLIFNRPRLNDFMALGPETWRLVRAELTRLLREDEPALRDDAELRAEAFVPLNEATLLMPVEIGDYTDFYASREHATNVGTILRGPENALPPNWLHLPIAYHGRASSIVLSGTKISRPRGQILPPGADAPIFAPSRAVDFELEFGVLIGAGNAWGTPIPVDQAWEHIFGFVLVNDWSARDIQKWEYQPLGPFLAKNFATSISPWVVPLAALEPFATEGPPQDPEPLDYLKTSDNRTFDVQLEAWLQTASLAEPQRICQTNLQHMYWNIAQQIAHHTVGGCNLRTGDLLATGTISGPAPDSLGSLLELTQAGREPLRLTNGETRGYLDDGDRITLTGYAQGEGFRIGFGEVAGQILPARREE